MLEMLGDGLLAADRAVHHLLCSCCHSFELDSSFLLASCLHTSGFLSFCVIIRLIFQFVSSIIYAADHRSRSRVFPLLVVLSLVSHSLVFSSLCFAPRVICSYASHPVTCFLC